MKTRPFAALVAASATQVAMAVAASAAAQTAPDAQRASAAAACERAVQETLRDTRGAASNAATFKSPPSVVPAPADASEMTLRGAGQLRSGTATRPFSYSCSYDVGTASVSGVVVRDAAPAPAPTAARPVEPDLRHVSPTACESAAAAELKRRWPAVTQINFNPATRKLSQDSDGIASLSGQGSAAPTMRGPDVHFSYDCAIDARNGRVMKMAIGS